MVKRKTVRKVYKKSRRKSIKRISRKTKRGGKNSKKGIRIFKKNNSKKKKRTQKRKLKIQIRNNRIHVNRTVRIGNFKLRPGNKLNFLPQDRNYKKGGAAAQVGNDEKQWRNLLYTQLSDFLNKGDVIEYKKPSSNKEDPFKYYCVTDKDTEGIRISSYLINRDKEKHKILKNSGINTEVHNANKMMERRKLIPPSVIKACKSKRGTEQLDDYGIEWLEKYMINLNTLAPVNLQEPKFRKFGKIEIQKIKKKVITAQENLKILDPNLESWKPERIENADKFHLPQDTLCNLNHSVVLGHGSSGIVFKVDYDVDGVTKNIAVKQLTAENDRKDVLQNKIVEFKQEVNMMVRLNHPNIVKIYGYCVSPHLKVGMELMEDGDLQDLLARKNSQIFEKGEQIQFMYDIAMGMEYLHSLKPPVIHRDLKPGNIMISKNEHTERILKIADFGLAREMDDKILMTQAGTPTFTAPEISAGKKYNELVDVYSCAIVYWQIYSRETPYIGKEGLQVHIEASMPPDDTGKLTRPDMEKAVKGEIPNKVKSLIIKMWDHYPTNRPTFTEVCNELEGVAKELKFTLRTSSRPAQVQAAQAAQAAQAVQVQGAVEDDV